MHDDIAAAIEEFKKRAPHIRGVILWGGCDAATSALINAHKFSDVISVIAGNPFVSSPATASKKVNKHYRTRLLQASFWKKVIRMEYNLGEYAAAALRKLQRKEHKPGGNKSERKIDENNGNFLNDLLVGLQHFNGKILFLMGDRFLTSDEFDALMNSSPQWRTASAKPNHERIDIKGGDQVFSSNEAQERMFDVASEWIHRTFSEHGLPNSLPIVQQAVQSTDEQSPA
jgi:hypothetical protein